MNFRTPTEPVVDTPGGPPPRPNFWERCILARQVLHHALCLLREPERTDCVFLIALYSDVLLPGRHLEAFVQPGYVLPPLSFLRSLSEGSLGYTYALYAQALQAEGGNLDTVLNSALQADRGTASEALRLRFYDIRRVQRGRALTDQHDLWHVLTGYDTSEVGEVCLQAFSHAQVGNGLSLLITCGGLLRALSRGEWSLFGRVLAAYRRGKQCKPLVTINWDSFWELGARAACHRVGLLPISESFPSTRVVGAR
ncbi:MAG: hypothetical protein H7Y22_08380 [Gemmatimonadaceae bacterium]|nr:hypothetical protein [Gloeobacterales cyanobacterium ES-bin-141]